MLAAVASFHLVTATAAPEEVQPAAPPPVQPPSASPAQQKAAVRPPVLPTPGWFHSEKPKPQLGDAEARKEDARFYAFNIESLPADEYEVWRGRWRGKCQVESNEDSEALTMLVRLRDEDVVKWQLSRLEQGQGTSTDAAGILGNSGQEWLIPKLEKTLFLKAEDEPPDEHPSDVVFQPVSEASSNALKKIVEKSRIISPRVKSWFSLVFHDSHGEDDLSAQRELLKQWWALNKNRMVAGDFRHLRIIPLWPGELAGDGEKDVPYTFSDYLAALHSDQMPIQVAAMETILSRKLAKELDFVDLEYVAGFMAAKEPLLRNQAYRLLIASGDHATEIFKKLMDQDPAKVPALVTVDALKANPIYARDRALFIATIVAYDSTSYLGNHMSMQVEAYPLLKQRVLNPNLSEDDRVSANSYLGLFASTRDIPFFEEQLKPTQPKRIREGAFYQICRLSPPGNPPASIRALENDPDLGPVIKRVIEDAVKSEALNAERAALNKAEQADEIQMRKKHDDIEVVEKFGSLMAYALTYGRNQPAYELAQCGQRGETFLKLAVTMSNEEARTYAARYLMEFYEPTQEESAVYLSALVAGLGSDDSEISNYLRRREDLHAAALPLLKGRVLDIHLPYSVRTFAALHVAAWATKEDLPFFESILTREFPGTVRSTALHAIYRILPPDEVPESVRALSGDPELGEVMKIYRYGGKSE